MPNIGLENITVSEDETINNILSTENIDYINNTIANIFREEGEKNISLNVIALNKEINKIIKNVQLEQVKVGKANKYRIIDPQPMKNALMAEAYLLIFKLREFLTSESIDYRYYFESVKGRAQVVTFTDNELLKYIRNGQYGLNILVSAVKKATKANNYQQLLDLHYQKLMEGLKPIETKNGIRYCVHKKIHDQYVEKNPKLLRYPGTDDHTYMFFNKGHIFEAIDKAFTEAMIKEKVDSYRIIQNAMYGKYLKRDTGKGIKSGDNEMTMTQIKSNSADFMQYSTLLSTLKELQQIFKVPPELEKRKLKEQLVKVFVDEKRYKTQKAYNEMVKKIFNNFVQSMGIKKV